jgi:quercetin dioxygenase-like cupin family protein
MVRMGPRHRIQPHEHRSAWIAGTLGALVGAVQLVVPARATQPTPQVTATVLAKSLFDQIHVNAHANIPHRWKVQLKTHGQSDVYVVDNKFPPGATVGWHPHPGPSLILVVAGTVTNYPSCPPHVYAAGAGFVDPGSGHVHLLRNETSTSAETIAVQLLPKDAARRIDAPDPGNCPF